MGKYAQTDKEAARRYRQWQRIDPFPKIVPALLNSADIADYVAATGMVHPFYDDRDRLKPASYEVALGGTYVYWDENGQRLEAEIDKGDPFYLRANSIVFVSVEPYFRLPEYIAIRFNLRITHIYRGILLGTGPLVDPGFEGPLSMPLHNLTNNDYLLRGGEGLIWMEFTKVSPNPKAPHKSLLTTVPGRFGKVVPLEPDKLKRDVGYYLQKAFPGKDIRSSIPDALQSAEHGALDAADSARESSESTERNRRFIGLATLLALILGLLSAVGVVAGLYALFNNLDARIDTLADARAASPSPLASEAFLQNRLTSIEGQLEDLTRFVWTAVLIPAALVGAASFVVLKSFGNKSGYIPSGTGKSESDEQGTSEPSGEQGTSAPSGDGLP